MSIQSAIHADCYADFKSEEEHALVLASTGDGLDFINAKIHEGKLNHGNKQQLTNDCFTFLLNKYYAKDKPATGTLSSMVFWWVARRVLWWLAQKLIQKALDAAVQS